MRKQRKEAIVLPQSIGQDSSIYRFKGASKILKKKKKSIIKIYDNFCLPLININISLIYCSRPNSPLNSSSVQLSHICLYIGKQH